MRDALILPPSVDMLERWTVRRDELQKLHARVDGAVLCEDFLADLKLLLNGEGQRPLTIGEAASVSGYSADHIRRLIKKGTVRNVGKPRAPRVLLSDLPRKPASQVAASNARTYDPASDARFIREPTVRSVTNGS